MDEMNTPSSQVQAQVPTERPLLEEETVVNLATGKPMPESPEAAGTEHRQAYGTAKTENLRDNGLWRILLPLVVGLLCLSLFAVPLIILIPLLGGSLDAKSTTHSLTWLWITMIVLVLGTAAVIVQGLVRIFMTQANNYRRV